MSKKKYNNNKNVSEKNFNIYEIIPLLLIALLVPLIVYFKEVPLKGANLEYWSGQKVSYDFFTYYKMLYFLILSGITFLILLLKYKKEKFTIKKTKIYIPMGIYTLTIILSTLFSKYKDVALFGFVERYEGMLVLVAYMVVMFAAINLFDDEKNIKYFLRALIMTSTVIGFIGILQYFNYDLFKTSFGQGMILPNSKALKLGIKFSLGDNSIYSTLYHYNYVGSYMAMLFPFSLVIILLSKNLKHKILTSLFALLMFANWIASKSRAGVIGGVFALLLIVIIFRKKLLKNWKYVILGGVVTISAFLYLNRASLGSLTSKLSTLYLEPNATFSSEQLKDINMVDKKLNIITDEYPITAEVVSDHVEFRDDKGNIIPFEYKEGQILFINDNYKKYLFTMRATNIGTVMEMQLNEIKANFLVSNEGFKALDYRSKPIEIHDIEKWGFEGRETLGSSRGYIWSRSIPLLKRTMFLGFGPDTFAIYFPQDDFMGKIKAYGISNIMVDKPHNLYLQTGINTGVISLLAMLAIFILYLIESLKLYFKCDFNSTFKIVGAATFVSVYGYLGAAFFNDSVVSVAPVFWILLGVGISINLRLKQEKIKDL